MFMLIGFDRLKKITTAGLALPTLPAWLQGWNPVVAWGTKARTHHPILLNWLLQSRQRAWGVRDVLFQLGQGKRAIFPPS